MDCSGRGYGAQSRLHACRQPDGKRLCSARRTYATFNRSAVSKRAERALIEAAVGIAPDAPYAAITSPNVAGAGATPQADTNSAAAHSAIAQRSQPELQATQLSSPIAGLLSAKSGVADASQWQGCSPLGGSSGAQASDSPATPVLRLPALPAGHCSQLRTLAATGGAASPSPVRDEALESLTVDRSGGHGESPCGAEVRPVPTLRLPALPKTPPTCAARAPASCARVSDGRPPSALQDRASLPLSPHPSEATCTPDSLPGGARPCAHGSERLTASSKPDLPGYAATEHKSTTAQPGATREQPDPPPQLGAELSLRDMAAPAHGTPVMAETPQLRGDGAANAPKPSTATPGSTWQPPQSALAALPGVLCYGAADAEGIDTWASQSQDAPATAQASPLGGDEARRTQQVDEDYADAAARKEQTLATSEAPQSGAVQPSPAPPGHDRAAPPAREQSCAFSQDSAASLGDFSQQGTVSGGSAEENRIILHVDVDCFYCQVEALDNPALRGRPLAVQQGNSGGFVAVSYEAQARGVQKGDGVGAGGRAAIKHLQDIGARLDDCGAVSCVAVVSAIMQLRLRANHTHWSARAQVP